MESLDDIQSTIKCMGINYGGIGTVLIIVPFIMLIRKDLLHFFKEPEERASFQWDPAYSFFWYTASLALTFTPFIRGLSTCTGSLPFESLFAYQLSVSAQFIREHVNYNKLMQKPHSEDEEINTGNVPMTLIGKVNQRYGGIRGFSYRPSNELMAAVWTPLRVTVMTLWYFLILLQLALLIFAIWGCTAIYNQNLFIENLPAAHHAIIITFYVTVIGPPVVAFFTINAAVTYGSSLELFKILFPLVKGILSFVIMMVAVWVPARIAEDGWGVGVWEFKLNAVLHTCGMIMMWV